jgi:hypothetical protein
VIDQETDKQPGPMRAVEPMEKKIDKDEEGSSRSLTEVPARICLEGLRKHTKYLNH